MGISGVSHLLRGSRTQLCNLRTLCISYGSSVTSSLLYAGALLALHVLTLASTLPVADAAVSVEVQQSGAANPNLPSESVALERRGPADQRVGDGVAQGGFVIERKPSSTGPVFQLAAFLVGLAIGGLCLSLKAKRERKDGAGKEEAEALLKKLNQEKLKFEEEKRTFLEKEQRLAELEERLGKEDATLQKEKEEGTKDKGEDAPGKEETEALEKRLDQLKLKFEKEKRILLEREQQLEQRLAELEESLGIKEGRGPPEKEEKDLAEEKPEASPSEEAPQEKTAEDPKDMDEVKDALIQLQRARLKFEKDLLLFEEERDAFEEAKPIFEEEKKRFEEEKKRFEEEKKRFEEEKKRFEEAQNASAEFEEDLDALLEGVKKQAEQFASDKKRLKELQLQLGDGDDGDEGEDFAESAAEKT